ncbi:TniB family NTP-binding protein [Streptomyces sp. NPDC058892]|uniref:TniB family NTP-binding protein n=1 Tax=unclassified Streptomyces TaxID=2593676 RepID=UPI0036C78B85
MNSPSPSAPAAKAPPDNPLTTKEGWRHFVDHEPVPPRMLTAGERAALGPRGRMREDERRREYHADLPMVNTPVIRKVTTTSRLLIQLNRNQISARRGVIVSGASGTGKTTALTQLGRAHGLAIRKRHPRDRNRLPVLYVTVPPAATPKMLAMEFARFFGLTFPARANITDVVDAVCATAAHVHVDLVLVDEIHNLTLTTRSGAEASDQLKYFAERLPATFAYPASTSSPRVSSLAHEDGRSPAASSSSPLSPSRTPQLPIAKPGGPWWEPLSPRCGCTTTPQELSRS